MSRTIPKIRRCSPDIPNITHVYRAVIRVSIGVLSLYLTLIRMSAPCEADEITPTGSNTYQLVTGDDSEADRRNWDKLYDTRSYVYGKEPAAILREHIGTLRGGRVLDLAMGEGRNAVYLAKKGFIVDGVDISEVALRKSKRLARENHVSLNTVIADLNTYKIKSNFYDVIINVDYLQRNLIPEMKRGLKKQGIVIFENFTGAQVPGRKGQIRRQDAFLKKGELKELFKDFKILVYREFNDGKHAKASLVARKP